MKGGLSASSASAKKGECPFCFVPLIRIRSKQENTKDIWFVKCLYNVKVQFSSHFGSVCSCCDANRL
jgi:hypothetical protein